LASKLEAGEKHATCCSNAVCAINFVDKLSNNLAHTKNTELAGTRSVLLQRLASLTLAFVWGCHTKVVTEYTDNNPSAGAQKQR
jgi:hypothetical protein